MASPGLPAPPRSKLLRFRHSGSPQRHRLGWACVLETVSDFIFRAPKSLQMVTAAMKLKDLTPWKESYDQPTSLPFQVPDDQCPSSPIISGSNRQPHRSPATPQSLTIRASIPGRSHTSGWSRSLTRSLLVSDKVKVKPPSPPHSPQLCSVTRGICDQGSLSPAGSLISPRSHSSSSLSAHRP